MTGTHAGYLAVSFGCAPDRAEEVSGCLFGLGSCGVEEREPGLLTAYFTKEALPSAEDLIELCADTGSVIRSHSELSDRDWKEHWRENYRSVALSERTIVVPSWVEGDFSSYKHVISIDPKLVFGTGHHETTRVCARLIERHVDLFGDRFLDVGTGTGILPIVAAMNGMKRVVCFDIDVNCVENTVENFQTNGIDNALLFAGTIDAIRPHPLFSGGSANMIRTILFPQVPRIKALLEPGSHFVFSGLLQAEREVSVSHFKDHGMGVVDELSENEWWGCVVINGQ